LPFVVSLTLIHRLPLCPRASNLPLAFDYITLSSAMETMCQTGASYGPFGVPLAPFDRQQPAFATATSDDRDVEIDSDTLLRALCESTIDPTLADYMWPLGEPFVPCCESSAQTLFLPHLAFAPRRARPFAI